MVLRYKNRTAEKKAMAYIHIHPETLSGRHQEVEVHGKKIKVHHSPCSACMGSGRLPMLGRCTHCDGTGKY